MNARSFSISVVLFALILFGTPVWAEEDTSQASDAPPAETISVVTADDVDLEAEAPPAEATDSMVPESIVPQAENPETESADAFYQDSEEADALEEARLAWEAENLADYEKAEKLGIESKEKMGAMAMGGPGELASGTSSDAEQFPLGDRQAGSYGHSYSIKVPPGRNGMAPNIKLVYSSHRKNSWLGVGWDINMGAIRRAMKKGVDLTGDDYVYERNGGSSELVDRTSDWGANYYGAKVESGFTKYYKNPSTGGFEATGRGGTTYYFGTTVASRQTSTSNQVFKWCLDKVQDTNGNYMTLTYGKYSGEIYLARIDYTGHTSDSTTTNYISFLRQYRTDDLVSFKTNFSVRT